MPSPLQQFGNHGEAIAREYLEKMGYVFLERHWHSRYGEIDLIMQEKDELVFVEVKLRTSTTFGVPEEMVSREKSKRISKTAYSYLENHNPRELFWRFDTIAITLQGSHYEIFHLKDTIRHDEL
jgi:putative endonuclease